jgi:thiamine biosynthesis protein ThiS
MTIRLNGKLFELAVPLTVQALLDQLGIESARVAVEHNLVVLKRAAYAETVIAEGDEIEIVNFVGGGIEQAGGSRPVAGAPGARHHSASESAALKLVE